MVYTCATVSTQAILRFAMVPMPSSRESFRRGFLSIEGEVEIQFKKMNVFPTSPMAIANDLKNRLFQPSMHLF